MVYKPVPANRGLKKKRGEPIAEGQVVYAIKAMALIKIGRTTDLNRRLRALQGMNPTPLLLLGTCPGGHELERALHRQFAPFRSHGEWFNLPAKQIEVLQGRLNGEPWIMRLEKVRRPSTKKRRRPHRRR